MGPGGLIGQGGAGGSRSIHLLERELRQVTGLACHSDSISSLSRAGQGSCFRQSQHPAWQAAWCQGSFWLMSWVWSCWCHHEDCPSEPPWHRRPLTPGLLAGRSSGLAWAQACGTLVLLGEKWQHSASPEVLPTSHQPEEAKGQGAACPSAGARLQVWSLGPPPPREGHGWTPGFPLSRTHLPLVCLQ